MRKERGERLPCGLLRDWAAKLQWPIFLTTACDESNDGAEHRHDCDLLGHGSTPDLCSYTLRIAKFRWASQDQN
jgi:hypothetical protein